MLHSSPPKFHAQINFALCLRKKRLVCKGVKASTKFWRIINLVKLSDCVVGRSLNKFHELSLHHGPVTCCAFSLDGETLATCSYDKSIILWDPVSKKHVLRLFFVLTLLWENLVITLLSVK